MRTIIIPDCSYEKYRAIMDAIMDTIPFAVLNQNYSQNTQKAMINFWDSDYIPEELKEYMLIPSTLRENVEELQKRLIKAIL